MSQCGFKVIAAPNGEYMAAVRAAAELMDKGIFHVVLPAADASLSGQVEASGCWDDAEKSLLEHLSKQYA